MAGFGVSVTDYDDDVVGTEGYIIKVDTTSLLFNIVKNVQAQDDPTDTPAPAIDEVTLPVLHGYLNSAACPDLAFNNGDGEVSIFFKTATFPYVSATRFALFGLRNTQGTTSDSDKLDIPDKDIPLLKLYALNDAYLGVKGTSTRDISNGVDAAEQKIRDEV